jgi:hypothetical protein
MYYHRFWWIFYALVNKKQVLDFLGRGAWKDAPVTMPPPSYYVAYRCSGQKVRRVHHMENGEDMNLQLHFSAQNVLAIIAGVAILIRPKLLNFIVAIYLILIGAIGILGIRI